jgi:gamma-glutamyltranspeptidase / glutathione hydrolase
MHFSRILVAIVAVLLAASNGPIMTAQNQAIPSVPTDPRDPLLNQGPKTEAVGDKVMVSTQLPIVTAAALKVLRDGGNAADAFITAVFLQNVVDFHQVELFGAMGGLYYDAASSKYYVFDAYSERPRSDTCGGQGDPLKVAVAGKVRGLEALAKRFGTRPWASYLQPAIAAAEEGVVVTSFMYANNYSLWQSGELIQKNKEAEAVYMPDGHLVGVGLRWKMPKLAETLRKVAAEGADYLYTGAWGQKFVQEARRRGYCVSTENMAEYQVRWEEAVHTTYRGYDIYGEPPPKKGGIQISYNLNILENFDLKKLGAYAQSADTLEIMARALGRVEDDLRYSIADPLNFRMPTQIWLSKDYAKIGADFVRNTTVQPNVNLAPATTTAAVDDQSSFGVAGDDWTGARDESNHDVIVDAQGNWVSSLHTGHGGAPGILIDGVRATGSNFRGQAAGPGRRVSANSTGTIVAKDGKPWLSLGSPGVPPQPVTEVLVNIIDFGMSPAAAVDAPRFFAFRGQDHLLEIESRISPEVRKQLGARGIKVKNLGPYDWNTGSMQVVWRDLTTGKLHGVTDPRRLGLAAGF